MGNGKVDNFDHFKIIMEKTSGFSVIELVLTVIAVPVLLVAVVLVVDPAQLIKDDRDAQRIIDTENILSAVSLYMLDNGSAPLGVTASEAQLGTDTSDCKISLGGCSVVNDVCLNLQIPLSKYLNPIPMDPKIGTAGKTAYTVLVDENKKIIVRACGTEGTESIYTMR